MQTDTPTDPNVAPPRAKPFAGHAPQAGLALLGLMAFGDWLLFGHGLGIALVPLALATFGAALWVRPVPVRRALGPAALLLVACLSVIEHVQTLSVLLLWGALLVALAWMHGRPGDWARPIWYIPVLGPVDLIRATSRIRLPATRGTPGAFLSAWALPLGGALVLGGLLAQANPILAEWLARLIDIRIDTARLIWRGLFWAGLAALLWPLLIGVPAGRDRTQTGRTVAGINPASVARALVVFNALLAVQTVTDAGFLWAGAALPEGMSYATYAHRGAYPLLATALLAIAFSLIARPHLGGSRGLRALLVLWLIQNLILTASSGLRLVVYVEAYGLTYLRLHAAIWMALVAGGLILALWQVARDRSTGWLLARGAGLALLTLYACSFVNVGAIVATQNLTREGNIDTYYVCNLPLTADAAIALHGEGRCGTLGPQIDDWRDWDFRKARIRAKLDAMEVRP